MKMIYLNVEDLMEADKEKYGDSWINSSHISRIKTNRLGRLIIYYEDEMIIIIGEETIRRIKNELNLIVEGEDT